MTKRAIIEGVWIEHMHCEFDLKDVDATMATMIAEPSINNIPTMLGGIGYKEVYHFYKHHFIPFIPKQTEITTISRTIDDDRLVDEQIFRFVHDNKVDFMLPNISPTGKTVAVPLIVIVYIENGKVAKEHIYWDQATVLKQIGLIKDEKLPILGKEEAEKMTNHKIPSNQLLKIAETHL